MKKNKKGFVLIELLIVAVFTASLFTFLYVNVVPLIGDYEQKEKYDTLDTKYVLYDIRKEILTLSDSVWNQVSQEIKNKGFSRLYAYEGSNIKCNTNLFKTYENTMREQEMIENNQTSNCNFLLRAYSLTSLYITHFGVGTYADGTVLPDGYKSLKALAKSNALQKDYNQKNGLSSPALDTEEYIKKMKNYTLGYELKKDYYRIVACMYKVDKNSTYCGRDRKSTRLNSSHL